MPSAASQFCFFSMHSKNIFTSSGTWSGKIYDPGRAKAAQFLLLIDFVKQVYLALRLLSNKLPNQCYASHIYSDIWKIRVGSEWPHAIEIAPS